MTYFDNITLWEIMTWDQPKGLPPESYQNVQDNTHMALLLNIYNSWL